MQKTLLILAGAFFAVGVRGLGCENPRVFCLSESSFTLNVTLFGQIFDFGVVLNCPPGHFCHEETDTPCKNFPQTTTTEEPPTTESTTEETTTEPPTTPTTTTTTTTTTPSPPTTVAPPECKKEGFHRANECHQYYECVRALFWYELRLRTCPDGSYYSATSPPCAKPPNVVCTN